jgi:hypothetical protein
MRALLLAIAAFVLALILGAGSALYAIRNGVPYATEKTGPWLSWPSEGHPDADPYTRAYLAASGRLPITSTAARYFLARSDDAGHGLNSSCRYLLQGRPLNARWWSIALYDDNGDLIANPSDRHSFNSSDLIRRSDGSYRIALAADVQPENWLPSGDKPDRKLVLMLRVYDPRETDPNGIGKIAADRLPTIERLSCR